MSTYSHARANTQVLHNTCIHRNALAASTQARHVAPHARRDKFVHARILFPPCSRKPSNGVLQHCNRLYDGRYASAERHVGRCAVPEEG